MVELLELKQKIRTLPCSISSINDAYSTLNVSRKDFEFGYSDNLFFFSYNENRDFYLNDLTYKDSHEWFIKYIFNKSDLENAKLIISHSDTINIFFEHKISLFIVNKITYYKHDPILVNEIIVSFFEIEDTLDVFNLLRKIKNISP